MKQWYTWTTVEAFDAWHDVVKQALGLPKPGINAKTGHVDVTAAWTTDYTSIIEVVEGDYRAMVQESIAEQFSEGLGALSEAPPLPEEITEE
jgi:hypothetical protein